MVPVGRLLGLQHETLDKGVRRFQLLQIPGAEKGAAVVSTSGVEWVTVAAGVSLRYR